VRLLAMTSTLRAAECCGEWIGLARFTTEGARWLREEIDLVEAEGTLDSADLPLLLTRLAERRTVNIHYVTGHWLDVDTLEDLSNARNFT
jgi:phosphoenolpyruvate phosphomutase